MHAPALADRVAAALAGRYLLRHELGGGGTAVVWLAEDLRHGRPVALKVLRPELVTGGAEERFAREIEIASRLSHPHLVPVLDSGNADGLLYLVMAYVEGETLGDRLRRDGALAPRDVLRILVDVADALAYAHDRGVVHRDIKPDNILLAGRHALVADFGVAKALGAVADAPRELTVGIALGTPAYMAPEQATADPAVDHRADLYALGAVAYHMLAGHPPFAGRTPQEILTAHVLDAPEPLESARPGVPAGLAAVVMRALEKLPSARWQTAHELLEQLEPLATPSTGTAAVALRRAPGWAGRLGWAAAAAVTLAAATVASRGLQGRAAGPSAGMQRRATFDGRVTEAAISPDGVEVAYLATEGDSAHLMLRELRTGRATRLASGRLLSAVSWASDGTEIRYVEGTLEATRIRAVSRLGTPPRDVAGAFDAGMVSLSPSGRRVALYRQATTVVQFRDLQSGDTTRAALGEDFTWGAAPAWSPDEHWVAVATESNRARRWTIRVAAPGDTRPAWVVVEDSVPIGAPTWAPDGRTLYFLRSAEELSELRRVRLDPARRTADRPTVLVGGLETGPIDITTGSPARLSLSADGRTFSVLRRSTWSNLVRIGVASRGGEREALTSGAATVTVARVTADGSAVAWLQTDGDGTRLLERRVAGGAVNEVARFDAAITLAWAPSGRALAVLSREADSGYAVRVLDRDRGTSRRYAAGRVGGSLAWLPDGSLLFTTTQNRALRRLDVATGRDEPWGEPPDTLGFIFDPRLAPDGRHFAYYWNRRPERGVVVADLMAGTRRRISSGLDIPLRWASDGTTLLSATWPAYGMQSGLWAWTGKGAPRELLRLGPGDEVSDVTPDARSAFVIASSRQGDAWLVTNPDAQR